MALLSMMFFLFSKNISELPFFHWVNITCKLLCDGERVVASRIMLQSISKLCRIVVLSYVVLSGAESNKTYAYR